MSNEPNDLIELLAEYRRAEEYRGEFCATDEQWSEVTEARDEALVALYPHVPAMANQLEAYKEEIEARENRRVAVEIAVMRAVAGETSACQKRAFEALKAKQDGGR